MSAVSVAAALIDSGTPWAQQLVDNAVNGCWACGVFNTVSAIGLSFADQVFGQLAQGMTLLIGLGLALWLLYFAARLFLPFGSPGANHWNAGAAKLFKLLLVLAFLQGSGPFWDYVFTPLMSAGMGIASQMAKATDGFEQQFGKSESPPNAGGKASGAIDYCAEADTLPKIDGMSASAIQAARAMAQMDCPMSRIQSQFAKGWVIGIAVMQQCNCNSTFLLPDIRGLTYLVSGLLLCLVYLFGYVVFPLLLIDTVLRVVLVTATSPLAIAATLFKPTERIAEKAVWALVQCALTLVFAGAIGGLGKATLAYVISSLPVAGGTKLNNWQTLINALEDPCRTGLSIDLFSASYYMLLGAGVMMIFMLRRANHMAAELTGQAAANTGAQAAIAFMAGGAAMLAGRTGQYITRKLREDGSTRGKSADKAGAVTGSRPG